MGCTPQEPNRLYHRHFQQLLQIATETFLLGKTGFYYIVPIGVVWPEGFPKGNRTRQGETEQQLYSREKRRLSTKKVLNWLYENGRSSYDYNMLLKESQAVHMRIVGLMNQTGLNNILDRLLKEE